MNAQERSAVGNQVARRRLALGRSRAYARKPAQWVDSVVCPAHKIAVPVKADGTLGGYCFKCLGEAAGVLERWGYEWRLKGFASGRIRGRRDG